MLNVNVDRRGPVPLHDQVAAQIRHAIADREAGPGELLEFRGGRGIMVAATPQRGAVLAQVRKLVDFASRQGDARSELIQMSSDLPRDA